MSARTKQISSALNHFYQNPVAKVSIELLLTVGLVLFLGIFAIRPTLITMSDLVKEIDDKTKLDQQLGQKIAALSQAQSEYLSVENRLSVLEEAIPNNPDVVRDLKLIEKMASEASIVITNTSINELPKPILGELPFDKLKRSAVSAKVNVTGDYPTIRSFAEKLRASRRVFVIESINFTLDEDRDTTQLRAQISISMPYYGAL